MSSGFVGVVPGALRLSAARASMVSTSKSTSAVRVRPTASASVTRPVRGKTTASANATRSSVSRPRRKLGPAVGSTTTSGRRAVRMSTAANSGPKDAEQAIRESNIIIFSTTYCPYCARVKALLSDLGVNFTVWDVDTMSNGKAIREWLTDFSGQRTVPNVFIRGEHIGGCDDTFDLHASGKLMKKIKG